MSDDGRCVVRGKSKKCLCTLEEQTRKERVEYETQAKAKAGLLRMLVDMSDDAARLYQSKAPRLQIVELP